MSKRKKIIITVIVTILVLLFAYGVYWVVDDLVMWKKLNSGPTFHTISESEAEYFSEESQLPLKDMAHILSFQFGYPFNGHPSAALYITVPNEKKEAFIEEAKKNYTEYDYPTPSNFTHNGKDCIKWYEWYKWYKRGQNTYSWIYEFEADEKETVFGIHIEITGSELTQIVKNKIRAGEK